jgi:hypothetical protein
MKGEITSRKNPITKIETIYRKGRGIFENIFI